MRSLRLYPSLDQSGDFSRVKAPGLADRKSGHIANIDRLAIGQPRELSHGSKSNVYSGWSILALIIPLALYAVLGIGSLHASVEICSTEAVLSAPKEYRYNPYVPLELWDYLHPYFLPENHPIKTKLDQIFKGERVILSKESFERAGFCKVKMRAPTNIIIGKHHRLEGYILKVYLDSQPPVVEWANWMDRITGAEGIRRCIKRHGYQKHFKVPLKWIYPLPAHPSPPDDAGYCRKNFILVVEDMQILSYAENTKAYRKKMTPELLNALYTILKEEGLLDSVYPDNTPFTKDGRIAFIDTEHHHKGPIKFEKLTGFFSPAMQQHWQQIIANGGP